ncbi:MAG: WecB/TagA/CpsF family glycosyltransferase [Spirochaetaceae bacterium]|nr:WecB/TagA/CpsF family glycosyltransferase [Spirochaetaceae bacterium]
MDAEKSQPIERLNLLKVPLDIVPEDRIDEVVYDLVKSGEGKNIVLLSLWDLLRARRSGEYRSFVLGAALVIPISKSLVRGARFLTGKTPVRYMPFNFVIKLLSALELREYSLYIIGGKPKVLKKAEKNIRETFPRLRIVGRYPGGFKRIEEPSILQAIRKASPSLLMIGKGVHGGERWIARNNTHLNGALRLWCSDLLDIFAERKRRPSEAIFNHGLEGIGFCFQNPLRFFRIFPFFYYKLLLLIYRIFKRGR